MKELQFVKSIARLENATALDSISAHATTLINSVFRRRGLRDVLHGVPAGHPMHPVMVQIPIGAWTSAAVLDLIPGMNAASTVLVGMGVAAAIPAASAGEVDWTELHEQQKRVGVVHAAANIVGTSLYTLSLVQRLRGHGTSGKVLSFIGLGIVSAGGFLGGHLSYRQAAGANHTEDVAHLFPAGWQHLGPLAALPEGKPHSVRVSGQDLVAVRRGSNVSVLSNVCSHLSGPLSDGQLTSYKGEVCISCPWHGSEFSLSTGKVVHGPATAPAPLFEVLVTDGMVEVRLANK